MDGLIRDGAFAAEYTDRAFHVKRHDSLQGHAEGVRESMSKDGNEIVGPRRIEYRLKTEPKADASAPKGAEIIKSYLPKAPATPGVYRMINEAGDVLYVGKAKNIRKRVTSYANPNRQSPRIRRMVAQTRSMEFVSTHTEAEALLLEADLIKKLTPRYNILLRDDKSFPSILITADHSFPQVLKHRGARKREGEYFGPFASAGAVNQSLHVMQRAFLLRTCTDSVFAARTRPCLLHQIKRCAAPCVGRISESDYGDLVAQARDFLTGKSAEIQRELSRRMQAASDAQAYEKAAEIRDRIKAMTSVQARQDISAQGLEDADVIALHQAGGQSCIQVFFVRGGYNFGNRAYYPSHGNEATRDQILEAFVGQFYTNKEPPRLLLLSDRVTEPALLAAALTEKAGRRVRLQVPQRGDKLGLVAFALENAERALGRRLGESATQRELLDGVAELFELDNRPERIEVYDNSHISGAKPVGGMIVSGPDGFMKNAYRKFNIRSAGPDGEAANAEAGDDYAMMREVLTRRFARALKEDPDRAEGQWPDLVLIDGGAGHLSAAREVFDELGVNDVALAAIAKGPDRNAGRERIFIPGLRPFRLDNRDPVLYFLQRLRDEAHRFAIGSHRARRSRDIERSPLDEIEGIGGVRKKALLHHFGSAKAVSQAGLADLEAVEGISKAMAARIYGWFHAED